MRAQKEAPVLCFSSLTHHALQKLGLSTRRQERLSCHYRQAFAKFVSDCEAEERRFIDLLYFFVRKSEKEPIAADSLRYFALLEVAL